MRGMGNPIAVLHLMHHGVSGCGVIQTHAPNGLLWGGCPFYLEKIVSIISSPKYNDPIRDSSSNEALVWSSPEARGCRELEITGVMQAKGSQESPHQKEPIMTGIMTSRESAESKSGG